MLTTLMLLLIALLGLQLVAIVGAALIGWHLWAAIHRHSREQFTRLDALVKGSHV